jgi:plastocyanin
MRRAQIAGRTLLAAALLAVPAVAVPAVAAPPPSDARGWLGEELPLPLAVRTPQDLAVKSVAEKQYLIFNLLAGGKLAWDGGDFATAATKWEALLRIRPLDPELEKTIKPLANEAHSRAAGRPAAEAASPTPVTTPSSVAPSSSTGAAASSPVVPASPTVSVSGTVSGGGPLGPGGAVIWLKRANGETPRPVPARGKMITQRGKVIVPHVLVVPVGSKVAFRNDDPIFHNIFSLSKPNDFDTGLYKEGATYTETFRHPGVVQLLCNIHASMFGFVVVVDTPYYAASEASGAFNIKGVPPGEYELQVWHEAAAKPTSEHLTVGAGGVRGLALKVAGDKRAPQFLPDKSGKPRQSHLGY